MKAVKSVMLPEETVISQPQSAVAFSISSQMRIVSFCPASSGTVT